jgi:hydroxymethylbilane synthase
VVELVEIRTTGDAKLDQSLQAIGGKGVFTKELEDAILDGRCDTAVHALKDLPTTLPRGLARACTPVREDPADIMILKGGAITDPWRDLPRGAPVGSSSPRRRALLLAKRPDLRIVEFRGNVDTRLRKLSDGKAEAIVLARAGLSRLGLLYSLPYGLHSFALAAPDWMPAVGQGCIGIEARANDTVTRGLLAPLHDNTAWIETTAERAFLRALGAGCSAPVGALARCGADKLEMWAATLAPDQAGDVRVHAIGSLAQPATLGESLAQQCLKRARA